MYFFLTCAYNSFLLAFKLGVGGQVQAGEVRTAAAETWRRRRQMQTRRSRRKGVFYGRDFGLELPAVQEVQDDNVKNARRNMNQEDIILEEEEDDVTTGKYRNERNSYYKTLCHQ